LAIASLLAVRPPGGAAGSVVESPRRGRRPTSAPGPPAETSCCPDPRCHITFLDRSRACRFCWGSSLIKTRFGGANPRSARGSSPQLNPLPITGEGDRSTLSRRRVGGGSVSGPGRAEFSGQCRRRPRGTSAPRGSERSPGRLGEADTRTDDMLHSDSISDGGDLLARQFPLEVAFGTRCADRPSSARRPSASATGLGRIA
jgi:hypothetical protein